MEFKERQRRQIEEEEERRKADAKQKHSSANTHPDYEFEYRVQSPDSVQESDSTISDLSPVPGSALWEADIDEIDLVKGEEGFGFTILDYAVSCQVN